MLTKEKQTEWLLNHKYHKPAKAFRRQVLLWILIGALAKWAAYLSENYGLSHGPNNTQKQTGGICSA